MHLDIIYLDALQKLCIEKAKTTNNLGSREYFLVNYIYVFPVALKLVLPRVFSLMDLGCYRGN